MAAVSLLQTHADTAAGASYTSAAFTPTAGALMVACVVSRGTTIDPGVFSTSDGITFTSVSRVLWLTNGQFLAVYVADGVSNAVSQTANWDCTGDASTGTAFAVLELTGMSRVGPDAVLQPFGQANGAATTTPEVVFSSAANAANPLIFVVGKALTADITEPATFTLLTNTGFLTPDTRLHVSHDDGGFTSDTVTAGSASDAGYAAIAIEFNASSLAGSIVPILNSYKRRRAA